MITKSQNVHKITYNNLSKKFLIVRVQREAGREEKSHKNDKNGRKREEHQKEKRFEIIDHRFKKFFKQSKRFSEFRVIC